MSDTGPYKSLGPLMQALIRGRTPTLSSVDLRMLRPAQGADVSELAFLIEGKGWRSALPNAFSDQTLVRLLWDFREAEAAVDDQNDGALQSLKPATYVVRSLLLQYPSTDAAWKVRVAGCEAIGRVLQLYQRALERELARRITGAGRPEDPEAFAGSLLGVLEG